MVYQVVGDTLAIAELSYKLYSKGYRVAKNALSDFSVLQQLLQIRNILGTFQALLRRDADKFDPSIEDALKSCWTALRKVEHFTDKYDKLADTDRGLWVRKFQWAKDHSELESLKNTLKDEPAHLHFCLTLLRESQTGRVSTEQPNNYRRHPDVDDSSSNLSEIVPGVESEPPTISNGLRHSTFSRLHSGRQWLYRFFWVPSVTSKPTGTLKEIRTQLNQLNQNRQRHELATAIRTRLKRSFNAQNDEMDIEAWLRIATWWLLKSRVEWGIGSALEDEMQCEPCSDAQQSLWHHNILITQARADLLKSSWILEDVILSPEYDDVGCTVVLKKMIWNLCDAIHNDLRVRGTQAKDDDAWDDDVVLPGALTLFEEFEQPAENTLPNADTLLNPHRFLTPDMDHAGLENETCLMRTFVNAQLGHKDVRMKSLNAPYMLTLWCPGSKCELWVSLINQKNTINLEYQLHSDDIKFADDVAKSPNSIRCPFPSMDATIKFLKPSDHESFIDFVKQFFADMELRRPRQGEVLTFRESLESYEIWNPAVAPTDLLPRQTQEARHACDISLYELIPDESWKVSRRLVICSSPAASDRWCRSYILPIDRVKVQRDDLRVRLVWSHVDHLESWTDGNYVKHYSYIYKPGKPTRAMDLLFNGSLAAETFIDFILDPFKTPYPSRHINLKDTFRSSFLEANIYNLRDMNDTGNHGYNAIVKIDRHSDEDNISHVHFVYRDFDFAITDHKGILISFPSLPAPHLLSSKVDMLDEPNPTEKAVDIAEITSQPSECLFTFDNIAQRAKFIRYLTGWNLEHRVTTMCVHLKSTNWLRSTRTFRNAVVGVWRKRGPDGKDKIRLTVRCDKQTGPIWLTADLATSQAIATNIRRHRAVLERLTLESGIVVDSSSMSAFGQTQGSVPQLARKWTLILTLNGPNDCDEFRNRTESLFRGVPLAMPFANSDESQELKVVT